MSATDTKALIAKSVDRFLSEVPALGNLKLVIRLELQAKGGDAPIWRVAVPGPTIDRDPAGGARVDVTVQRQEFNRLADDGALRDWARAYERGHVKVSGDASVIKLLGNVVERQLVRVRSQS